MATERFKKNRRLLPDLHEVEDKLYGGRKVLLWQGKKTEDSEVTRRLRLFGELQGNTHVIPVLDVYESGEYINMVMGTVENGPTYLLKDIPVSGEKLPEAYVRLFMQQLVYMGGMCNAMKLQDAINMRTILIKKHKLYLYIDCGNQIYSESSLPIEVHRGIESSCEARIVWSCGMLLYKMIYGIGVYEALKTFWWSMDQTIAMVIKGDLKPWFPPCGHVEKGGILLLSRMLEMDPTKRITLKEILEDPWLMQKFPGDLLF